MRDIPMLQIACDLYPYNWAVDGEEQETIRDVFVSIQAFLANTSGNAFKLECNSGEVLRIEFLEK